MLNIFIILNSKGDFCLIYTPPYIIVLGSGWDSLRFYNNISHHFVSVVCATCGRSTYVALLCVRRLSNWFKIYFISLNYDLVVNICCTTLLEVTDGRFIYRLKYSEMSIYTCFVILFILEKTKYLLKFLTIFFKQA
jgi:hypothetical protein